MWGGGVCSFFLLENSRPLSPWGPLDFLSTSLGIDTLTALSSDHILVEQLWTSHLTPRAPRYPHHVEKTHRIWWAEGWAELICEWRISAPHVQFSAQRNMTELVRGSENIMWGTAEGRKFSLSEETQGEHECCLPRGLLYEGESEPRAVGGIGGKGWEWQAHSTLERTAWEVGQPSGRAGSLGPGRPGCVARWSEDCGLGGVAGVGWEISLPGERWAELLILSHFICSFWGFSGAICGLFCLSLDASLRVSILFFFFWTFYFVLRNSLSGSDREESTCNAGDMGLIPGSGRSPGEGNSNPL